MKIGSLVMFGDMMGIVLSIGDKTAQVYFDDGEACAGIKWLEVLCK
jgi:hypothetical protein